MADLVVNKPKLTEVTPTANAGASGGDKFLNDGKTMMRLGNTSGGAIVVTIASQVVCDQGATHNESVSVPATTGRQAIGPFDPNRFNIKSGVDSGKVALTYDVNPPTGLTIELLTTAS